MDATIYLFSAGPTCIANLLPNPPAADIFSLSAPLTPVFKPR
jgi:hypothetical protein